MIKASSQYADFSALVQLSAFKDAHIQLDCQKKSSHAEKTVRKKVKLQASIFARLVRSLINLSFSTNQTEETGKQTKLRWHVVDHSQWQCYQYGKQFTSNTPVCFYQQQQQQEQLLQQQ